MYRYERRYTLGYFSLNSTHIQNTYDCFMYAFYVISVWDALIQLSRDKKRGRHIFPYKVYNLFIIYFQFHLETNKIFILNTFFNSLTG